MSPDEMGNGKALSAERQKYRRLLHEELDRWVSLLKERGATLILLFGSLARAEAGLLSDADLLVVMPSDRNFVERTAELYRLLTPRVDLDLIVYTPLEFERMRAFPFVRQALLEGRVLHEAAA